ncbi:adrenodoxin-like protein 2, mitochondrial isoform X1 [Manihot esculenta]|uniref:Uncharacterized protein n=3 Tax=Manihot esculenta TaxID=3983 RepID=A0ACB7G876_MANES|nr:adrenodoxin-like protein 2, mitochondrial isoform X1 [Manihot esculenta]XP_021597915.1 adrenodoxin-like protein 2, mitochondrial isoform X1 [Manihot esculenta]KAG8636027.1 hypothetical protein MANES_16G092300v8 [Manihot esculenta]KAG8636029.1 hypothetical protein MANES_16G092300v8 [Manihot esculenta]OAY27009.1 hypothetical protein MANES_16G092300v8 [Manihot esculenta]
MQVSRFSRIGIQTVKQLARGTCTSLCRTEFMRTPYSQCRQPWFELYPERKVFQGTLFQKHYLFSTTASGSDIGVGSEGKDTISVTFVDKDGEEKHIKVPVGMSMLEAAHENDIELEGSIDAVLILCFRLCVDYNVLSVIVSYLDLNPTKVQF